MGEGVYFGDTLTFIRQKLHEQYLRYSQKLYVNTLHTPHTSIHPHTGKYYKNHSTSCKFDRLLIFDQTVISSEFLTIDFQ